MKAIIPFITIVFAYSGYCQPSEFEKYYPSNPLFKKLKVRSTLDTMVTQPNRHYKMEYDTLGRLTSEYWTGESLRSMLRYETKGDTLIRYYYDSINLISKPVSRYDLFVYNDAGKIRLYQVVLGIKSNADSFLSVYQEDFHYNKKNELVSRIFYQKNKLPIIFTPDIRISKKLMHIVQKYTYYYKKNGYQHIIEELIGEHVARKMRRYNTYDKQRRLKTETEYQQRGILGEFVVSDLRTTRSYTYGFLENKIHRMTTYTDMMKAKKTRISDTENWHYVLYPNGLTKEVYIQTLNWPAYLLNSYTYEFYLEK